jgi:hypothetical protein
VEDTVEFFNLITGVNPAAHEKKPLVAFLRALSGFGSERLNGPPIMW